MNGPQISTKASILHHLWEFSALCTGKQNKTKPGLLEGSLNSKVLVFTRKKKKDFDLQKIRQRSLNKRSPQTWINATEKKSSRNW